MGSDAYAGMRACKAPPPPPKQRKATQREIGEVGRRVSRGGSGLLGSVVVLLRHSTAETKPFFPPPPGALPFPQIKSTCESAGNGGSLKHAAAIHFYFGCDPCSLQHAFVE